MPNYRLGIRYFDNNEREFFWKTTNKGCMRTRFFDIKSCMEHFGFKQIFHNLYEKI